jgi:hypothetical protein
MDEECTDRNNKQFGRSKVMIEKSVSKCIKQTNENDSWSV